MARLGAEPDENAIAALLAIEAGVRAAMAKKKRKGD
jgi:hypothetical protein